MTFFDTAQNALDTCAAVALNQTVELCPVQAPVVATTESALEEFLEG